MTLLLDEGKRGLGKFIPLVTISRLLVAVHKSRKLAMEKRCLLGQAKASLGESHVPLDALFMGKRTIMHLDHDIKSLLERRLELTRYDADSGGETHRDEVREEVLFGRRADGERDNVELEVCVMGGGALAGSVTTLETAEEAKGGVTVPPCLMSADVLAATGLDITFLVGLLGAMIQKMKEKRQKTRRR